MKCVAITQRKQRHQQEWVKLCENKAGFIIRDVPLCGTHFNAVYEGDIPVQIQLEVDQRDNFHVL